MKFEGILFDLDGTLIDSTKAIARAIGILTQFDSTTLFPLDGQVALSYLRGADV